jgi:hypothetical protein
MLRRTVPLILFCFCALSLQAQDLENIQIHGFATQGFLFSSNNNYLSMNSSSGSAQWTEGAISISDPVTDNLRIGMQLHMYQLGQFGGPNVQVDWASGDYRLNDRLGFRAGKIKTPLGLFNDSQDVDSLFLWVLLPQAMYPVDNRGFDLAELGGELYGSLNLGRRAGSLQFQGHAGYSSIDRNGGYSQQLAQFGLVFPDPPGGKTEGGDLRWMTPCRGLMLGFSVLGQAVDETAAEGSIHVPANLGMAYYAQWQTGKLYFAGEYWRTPINPTLTLGTTTVYVPLDQRSWYVMGSYHLTRRIDVGSYYSHYLNKAADTSLPENYSKDFVVSGRYNFNAYFYAKLEGHFLHGTGLGYYASTNPEGVKTNSNMLAAKVGFSF